LLAGLLAAVLLPATALSETVSTSFENVPSGDFTIGTTPITATFTGGNAQTVGNPALYRSGSFSWHVSPGTTATVEFETPAMEVDFWFRDAPSGGPSEARVIDTDGNVLAQSSGTQSFQNVVVTRAAGESLIARVEIEHQGAAGAADTVVDDFSFTAEEATTPGSGLEDPIPAPVEEGPTTVQLVEILSGITAPVWAINSPNDTTRLFVVDQTGIIYAVDLATGAATEFADLSARLVELGVAGPGSFDERGLLGLAFHPDYASNGLLYTYTSEPVSGTADFTTLPAASDANHQSVIAEWEVPAPGDPASVVDPSTRRELLRIDQPQFNHDGGALVFGPDGMLYLALGDGGGADDEGTGHGAEGNGQDPSNPLGAILRIDPDGADSANGRYGIPSDNPFIGMSGFLDEIYAYGFRNPFRVSFDPATDDFWAADVGQNDIEEVDIVTAGGNYGWNLKEGSFFFVGNGDGDGFVVDEDPGVPADLIDPVAEYDHDEGIAIVGGFVYRGSRLPDLEGHYIFGDFGQASGRLFEFEQGGEILEIPLFERDGLDANVLGFGRDAEGEVYLLVNTTGTPSGDTGVVYRLDSTPGLLGFEMASVTVAEDAADALVSVTRTDGLAGQASVEVSTADGSATAGSDYTSTSETLTWVDGETGAKDVVIPIIDDDEEEDAETFEVSLANASGASLGTTTSATVTISANDEPAPAPPVDDGDDDDDGILGIGAFGVHTLALLVLFGFGRAVRNRR